MKDYEINSALRIAYEQSVIPFGIYQFKDMRISTLLLSNGFLKLFGYSNRDEALDKLEIELFRNIHPEDAARVADASVRFASGDNKYDVTYRSKMGDEYRIIHAMGMEIFTADGTRLCVVWYMDESAKVIHDDKEASLIAEIGQSYLNESILGKSNFDYLTGLPNMTYFFQLATTSRDKFLAEGEHCLIGYASMNGMKYFNQKFGFAEGDKILRSFAKLLAENFGNDNSCRVGQDNFAFFTSVENVEEKINSVISEFEKIVEGRVTFRTGIYTSKMGAVDASLACDRARYACNTLRNQNRSGFVYFSNDMLEYENRRRYVIDNLDRAISEKWIRAYYQPIVRTANGKVSDEEALEIWIDPEFGMLSPAEFIPILEDAKLIYKVDLHMVDEILKKMKDQAAAGLYVVPSSVNLSRTDFDACDIVKEITDRVDAAGIDRSMLTIEITESVVGSDFDFIKEQVERFQRLGFHVWMDDFGSGYSSLDVLQSIHFDLIKLDMRFMKQFDNGDKSRVIITELMKMALCLGI